MLKTPNYLTIEENIALIDEPNSQICLRILNDNRPLFEKARGSTHNHQTWEGGYIDHVTDGMNYCRHLYAFMRVSGDPSPLLALMRFWSFSCMTWKSPGGLWLLLTVV